MEMMKITEYERQQEGLALAEILALGNQQIAEGKYQDADSFFAEMEKENRQQINKSLKCLSEK
jgi:hypothetical protein